MRILRTFVVLVALLTGWQVAAAQDYPSRPVKIIVPFAAGSSTDVLARVLAKDLQRQLGQPFIVENKAGADGVIAAQAVIAAEPDGNTLFVTTHTSQAANVSLFKSLPYDPLRDFSPISRLTSGQFILAVNPTVPAKSVDELIGHIKANPGKYSYATANATSTVAMAWLAALKDLEIVRVNYASAPRAVADLLANHVQLTFGDQANVAPLVQDGRLTGLAVTGVSRSDLVPALPTMREAGVSELVLNSWAALYGPAKLPAAIIDKLNKAVLAAYSEADVVKALKTAGYDLVPSTPAELAAFNKQQIEVWRTAVTLGKIEPR
ncbi:tripartite tricarboxylate transporter substrate-binding protein [Bradyrhizobium sp. LHD-71]|uniref:Bug family tripartite tricarboxylate transporter substrate binding protein n=1 Tax=Bradyrhizobium sp. LHD-71 TaxID=3072141 RepID=UPI00280C64D4|nr:tripartite tricarboxylate transporter substrate-binding protein [Bradyrhizobium sp. LHD-71]MDQ8730958.1 tripartite tricarboxylate transporter substrate-binding protein [Bradyrhizobium sp. LHD-71]